jgi:hypothetical protein
VSITLAEIKAQARQRADMLQSQFVSDGELTSYINSSLAELHDLLIAAYNEEYYMEEVQFTSSGSITYPLPNGTNYAGAPKFYKLRGVDVRQGASNDWASLHRFNFNRRNQTYQGNVLSTYGLPYLEYRITGQNLRLNRLPDANLTFRIFYYPTAQKLVLDSDVFEDFNNFVEYVIVDTAIKMLTKEESDTQVLLLQKTALKARIEAMAKDRDANEPESVSDVYAEYCEDDFFRRY